MSSVAEVFGSGLTHKVSVYVPSTVDVNQSLNESAAKEIIHRVQREMSNLFGGATAITTEGAWVSQSGELVTEQVTVVYSFADVLASDVLVQIKTLAESLKVELKQESVAVEIDGMLVFV